LRTIITAGTSPQRSRKGGKSTTAAAAAIGGRKIVAVVIVVPSPVVGLFGRIVIVLSLLIFSFGNSRSQHGRRSHHDLLQD